jgi:hypothetical protein
MLHYLKHRFLETPKYQKMFRQYTAIQRRPTHTRADYRHGFSADFSFDVWKKSLIL